MLAEQLDAFMDRLIDARTPGDALHRRSGHAVGVGLRPRPAYNDCRLRVAALEKLRTIG